MNACTTHTRMLTLIKLIYFILIEVGNMETYICSIVKQFLIEDFDSLYVGLRGYLIFLVIRWKLGYVKCLS